MDIDELKQILEIVREHGITEFELEREDGKLRIRKGGRTAPPPVDAVEPPIPAGALPVPPPAAGPGPARAASGPAPVGSEPVEAPNVTVVKSPIVGTFYRAHEPGARPFVEVGTAVRKGQVLCIIEAMKLMNEITSEYDGEVTAVFVENGQPVQYGERLFGIRRA